MYVSVATELHFVCSTFLGAASPFRVCRQEAPGTRELKISSAVGEETHTEVQRCEEMNQGFQGARECMAKELVPPHLNNNNNNNNNKKQKTKIPKIFWNITFNVVAIAWFVLN